MGDCKFSLCNPIPDLYDQFSLRDKYTYIHSPILQEFLTKEIFRLLN
jgi:hypothetical protein